VLEDLHVARTVHRLQREDAVILRLLVGAGDREHVLAIPAPVARGLPQRVVEHLRRVDLVIVVLDAPAHIGEQVLEHAPALGVPEDDARPFFLEVEQVHLAAEPAMIALLGLFQHVQVGSSSCWFAQAVP
jgi:hypothetical protein